ncbi:MAG TPA: hypothetical protein PKD73_03545 [Burkholderiaceae bacterium]|nr:hypothetical protein [Burkholderiaceae bacterium]
MNDFYRLDLPVTSDQAGRLALLQDLFSQACNLLALEVQARRTWSRIALHHACYEDLRARFPDLGSQMACNAIYAVSKTCRLVFQGSSSPLRVARNRSTLNQRPLLRFAADGPVYFDRKTLTVRQRELSMFTTEGRLTIPMVFELADFQSIAQGSWREATLTRTATDRYQITIEIRPNDETTISASPASTTLREHA